MECEEHFDELVRSERAGRHLPELRRCEGAEAALRVRRPRRDVQAQLQPRGRRAAAGAAAAAAAAATEAASGARPRLRSRAGRSGRRLVGDDAPSAQRRSARSLSRPPGASAARSRRTHAGRLRRGQSRRRARARGRGTRFHEDRDGLPFAGRARDLLERLLGGIGLRLDDVYLATVLKCRPPGNRDPLPEETAACEPLPLPPARARPAARRRDPRQLRDRAPLRPRARDHASPRPGAGGDARRANGDPLPALPSGRRALHADDARRPRARRRAPPGAARGTTPTTDPRSRVRAQPTPDETPSRRRQPVQLGLF